MYGKTHALFGIGIASILFFWLKLSLYLLPFGLIGAGIMSLASDYDQSLGIPHRTWTHNPITVVILGLLLTIIVYLILAFLHRIFHLTWFSFSYTIGDLIQYQFFVLIIAYIVAGLTHLFLDITTKSGLTINDEHSAGLMLSSGQFGNAVFGFLGAILIVVGNFGLIIVNVLDTTLQTQLNWIIGIVCFCSIVLFLASVLIRKRKERLPLYCGLLNGIDICSTLPCLKDRNGTEICFPKRK